jgi:hypothetical protein
VHRITMLMVIPIVSVMLAATNYFHEFMWFLPSRYFSCRCRGVSNIRSHDLLEKAM